MPVVAVVVAVAVIVAVGVVAVVVGVPLAVVVAVAVIVAVDVGVVVVGVPLALVVVVAVGVSPIGVVAVRVGPWANSWAGAGGTTIRLITPIESGATIITRLKMTSMISRAVQRTGAPRG
jgi:hypothetical protein